MNWRKITKQAILQNTVKIPSTLKSAQSSFYRAVLLIGYGGLSEAVTRPLISPHLTVFEVTADSYCAVMALPLSLARVRAFPGPLKYPHTLAQFLKRRKGCVWASLSKKIKIKRSSTRFPYPQGTPGLLVPRMKMCALWPFVQSAQERREPGLRVREKKVWLYRKHV